MKTKRIAELGLLCLLVAVPAFADSIEDAERARSKAYQDLYQAYRSAPTHDRATFDRLQKQILAPVNKVEMDVQFQEAKRLAEGKHPARQVKFEIIGKEVVSNIDAPAASPVVRTPSAAASPVPPPEKAGLDGSGIKDVLEFKKAR
ncbi:MAG: hypothetical protein ACXWPM_06355 [Bdellovibrionota bacterium]